jgi:hypothetical protein
MSHAQVAKCRMGIREFKLEAWSQVEATQGFEAQPLRVQTANFQGVALPGLNSHFRNDAEVLKVIL